ncbi:MAG: hypothetical protein OXE59_03740 [Bacteroidetes bacterium]|nr:hypothetical protein [Bacteroidota bacterium]
MKKRLIKIRHQISQLRSTRQGQVALRVTRGVFTLGIILFLIWQLRNVEFQDVIHGLPLNLWFYLLLIMVYFLLPTIQFLAYRLVWQFRPGSAYRAFIKKRILNKEVLGYSGELYLFSWAKDHIEHSSKLIFEHIRDMNIISAIASTLIAIVLVGFFAFEGQVNIRDLISVTHSAFFLIGAVVTLIVALVVVKYRRKLFSMPWRATRIIFSLHIARLVVRQVLEITMWHLAMPEVPIEVWFTYAAVSIIVNQIPFIPSQDLVTLAVAVSIADVMAVSEAQITALFGAVAIVNRLINLIFFASLSIRVPENSDMITESFADSNE